MSKKKKVACLAQKDVKLYLSYFYAHKNLKKRLFSSYMFLCAQKSRNAQDVKRFFFLDVLCAQKCCIFYLLMCICCFLCFMLFMLSPRRFYARLRLLLFLFAYVLFMFFMLALRLSFYFLMCILCFLCQKQGTFFLSDVSMCV